MRPRNRAEKIARERERIIEDCIQPKGLAAAYVSVEERLEKLKAAKLQRQTDRRREDWKLDPQPELPESAELERRRRYGLAQG